MQRRRIQIDESGAYHDAIELDFETTKESWNLYRLTDGGHVRMRTVPVKMFRLLDENGQPASEPNGEPRIVVQHQTTVTAFEGAS